MNIPKLFLYSMQLTSRHYQLLDELVGKRPGDTRFACIENAADIIEGSENWLPGIRQSLAEKGYKVEAVDLRKFMDDKKALAEKLENKDVIWVCGGHTYYLRWILKASGADALIKDHVAAGKVYAGWSAGAIMAGPSTRYFDLMGDDPEEAPGIIYEGLDLTGTVIVPHMDNTDFAEGAKKANEALIKAGFNTVMLKDDQACIIDGNEQRIIG
ncbi:MAG: Type 1 glutamine amidotransferase-like domain-containing protein [Ferruginibacter sp.]|nr:Type 1 glutamine amidotransferase-like domain-containing protein [Ferruginibacter sp.]